MEKLPITIEPTDWGNLVSKFRPDSKQVSIADFTAGTINIDTDVNGNITKRKGGPNYNAILLAAAAKDQYEAIFSDGTRHLLVVANGEMKYSTGDTLFNTIVNGTGFSAGANFEFATTQDRVYGGNGVNPPQVYDKVTSYGGVAYTAPRLKNMGLQVPATPATAAVGAAGNVPAGSYTYKITYLYYGSEESNGSPVSNTVVPGVASQINLTSIPVGGYGVTARKIYRSSGPDWLLVGTLSDNTTTIFTDNSAAGTFLIPDDNNAPPVFALIASWLGRLWIAKIVGEPYTLLYSDANLPDVFLSDNIVLCNEQDPITGLVVYLDRLIIFNRKTMGQILGLTSDSFRYSDIQGSVGCVDNRTIQIRVVDGVPILVWLSDRGFYSYDGNSINYISEPIEDLVNFNIQQAVQQRGSHIQTTQAQFTAGTATPSIDLATTPDTITALNPTRSYDDQADWEGGLTKTNIATKDANDVRVPTRYIADIQQGNFNNVSYQGSYSGIKLPGVSAWSQWLISTQLSSGGNTPQFDEFLNKIVVPYASGTLTTLNLTQRIRKSSAGDPSTATLRFSVYSDSSGAPGSLIASTTVNFSTPTVTVYQSSIGATLNTFLGVGTYWVGCKLMNASATYKYEGFVGRNDGNSSSGNTGTAARVRLANGAWTTVQDLTANPQSVTGFTMNAIFSQSVVSQSGQWTSVAYDSKSIYVSGTMSIIQDISTQSNPSVASVQSYVEGSNDQSAWTVVHTATSNLDGTQTFAGAAYRYWRIRSVFSTNDAIYHQYQPILYSVRILFPQTGIWISNGIDCTTDVTAYNTLSAVTSIPGSTSISLEIATSTDNIAYSAFTSIGSAVVARYVRIRATLTATVANDTTPVLTSILFNWTTVGNLTSSGIDTGTTPSGWDIFQAAFVGSVVFQMRSAATLGGLTAATFYTVVNGDFPTTSITPLQFVQWRAILTTTANNLPTVDSVTINWFIGNTNNIRAASIFVDGRYYVAAAELGEATNNLLIVYDLKKKWRIYSGLNVSTFSYFFNRPYLGLSASGQIRRFLEGKTDAGVAIEVDVRTKAVDFSTSYVDVAEKLKILAKVILFVLGTGATYEVLFSLDEGETFTNLKTDTGSTTFTTSANNRPVPIRFKPDYTNGVTVGRTIIFKIHSNDTNDVEIQGLKAEAWIREGEPVVTG